jgi:GH15 family glucan-1,4-alpha-glucosidase
MERTTAYQPIENHGTNGDLNTVALVGLNGSIDFMCFSDLASPTVFAALLDKNKGSFFGKFPERNDIKNKQLYLPDTNILLTRFHGQNAIAGLTDFMPVEVMQVGKELVRTVSC